MAVATHNVPQVRQLTQTALRHGASPREIVRRIEGAVAGVKKTKGYDVCEHVPNQDRHC